MGEGWTEIRSLWLSLCVCVCGGGGVVIVEIRRGDYMHTERAACAPGDLLLYIFTSRDREETYGSNP